MELPIHGQGLDGLTLISPTHPEFDDIARPLLGRVADLALGLKPFLFIVSNESQQTVVSFSTRFQVIHDDGRVSTFLGHTSFPQVVCGDVLINREPAGLAPGAIRIEANGIVIQGWGNSDPYYDQFLPQFVEQKDRTLADAIDLRIELNAAILADGTLIGPDDESWLSDTFLRVCGGKAGVVSRHHRQTRCRGISRGGIRSSGAIFGELDQPLARRALAVSRKVLRILETTGGR